MADPYRIIRRADIPDVITGQPIEMGGSAGRTTATGDGAFHALSTMMARWDRKAEGSTVAVQGFGNAGRRFAKRCAESIVIGVDTARAARWLGGRSRWAGGAPAAKLCSAHAVCLFCRCPMLFRPTRPR